MASSPTKVAIVTGAAGGIGVATAEYFLARNYRVFGIDIKPTTAVPEILTTYAETFVYRQADLAQEGACDEATDACIEKFGRVDALINVAGVLDAFASADTLHDDEWDRVMLINVTVPVRFMRAVLKHFKEQKSGAIVNVASKAGVSGAVAGISYVSSKHALLGATKNVAWRFRNEGIRCNAVMPGGVQTEMTMAFDKERFDMDAFRECAVALVPHLGGSAGQMGNPILKPVDVAQSIFFLASDEASRITGICLPIDHGFSC